MSVQLTALKAQLDSNARTVELLETERSQLRGSVGELQARIRSLEGQVSPLLVLLVFVSFHRCSS